MRTAGTLVGIVLLALALKLKGFAHLHLSLGGPLWARSSHTAPGPADDADWTIELSGPGSARVRYRNVEVGSFHYAFWGKNFSWADPDAQPAPGKAGARGAAPQNVPSKDTFVVDVPGLGMKLRGVVRKSDRGLTFQYSVDTAAAVDGVVGGGLEFNLKLDSPVWQGQAGDVTLRPQNRGFDWTRAGAPVLAVGFDASLATVHFERGNQGQIRCFFVADHLTPGKRSWTMTIRLPPSGHVGPSTAERYGRDNPATWTPDTVVWDKWPVDVSFLNDGNRPAGVHGRLHARGDRLVFDDGTVGRFWGTNLVAEALYTGTKAEVANQARRIAALGYNLVRIHHHDSDWVSANVFAPGDTTQRLNDAALDAIDWWVKCLRDEGVYVWLDLKVGRRFRPGDGIPGFNELTKVEPTGRGFDYVNPRLQELEATFARQYLARVNRYTGRSYLDDPAVVAALIFNEDDLNTHFGNQMLPNQGNPVHQGLLRAAIEPSATALGIPVRQALQFWQPGPAKLVLADVEARFFDRTRTQLRGLGFGGLVVGTSYWGDEPLYGLASLAAGDLIDVHSYGDPESLGTDPRFEANFVSWIGAAQLVGKPLSVSEWNVEYPKRDRFTAPLYVAAIADLQGWDAPMVFNYSQDELRPPTNVDIWSTGYDPALTALMPAAAVMFRQQHVRPAERTFCFRPSREALYGSAITPVNSAALRTIVEQSRLVVALPDVAQVAWDDAASAAVPGATIVTDPNQDFLAPDATIIRSDTGELARDWGAGIETIDTPLSQAAVGWIGGHPIQLRDVEIRIDTPKAAVALTSLDGQPIASSKKVLVTVVGEVAASPGDRLPFLARPVRGSIVLRSSQTPRVMIPLSPVGHPGSAAPAAPLGAGIAPVVARPDRAGQLFALPQKLATHWWLLQPALPAR